MYLRDSFYALNGIHDRELNEKVFALWADNQGRDGAINTLVEPNIANLERKSNDSTPLWLMWALVNRRRFGTALPMDKVRRAAEYCLATFDPSREATCTAQFVMGQLDVIHYPQGTSILCENQGMLAVLLRVIRELQIPGLGASISESYIAKAEELYRSYYDPDLGFMSPARNIRDAIGFADIFPEFLSLWLFERKILTDEMVLSHLNRIPVMLPNRHALSLAKAAQSGQSLSECRQSAVAGVTLQINGTRWLATLLLPAMQAMPPTACITTAAVG